MMLGPGLEPGRGRGPRQILSLLRLPVSPSERRAHYTARVRRVQAALAVALLFAGLAPAAAQLPPLGVPRGAVRFDLGGTFNDYNERYRAGTRENLAAEYATPTAGSSLFQGYATAEARLLAAVGSATPLLLGRTSAYAEVNVGTATIGAAVGLTNRLTVFANLPLVRVRTQSVVTLDSLTGNAGVNPADPVFGTSGGQAQTQAFFSDFDAAMTALNQRIQSGAYDATPAVKQLAQQTLARGLQLRGDLFATMADPATALPYLPTPGSPTGTALTGTISSLQGTLAGPLGIPGFASQPALPARRMSQFEFDRLAASPFGDVRGRINGDTATFQPGDAELGAVYTAIDRWDRGGGRGGLRLALRGSVRLPTGKLPRDGLFFDPGSGTGSVVVEGGAVADVGRGPLGLRLTGSYAVAMAGTGVRRVAPPTDPLPFYDTRRDIEYTPGSTVFLEVRPFIRLNRDAALQAVASHWRQATASAAYAGDPLEGVDPSVLALETAADRSILGVGVTYANLGRLIPGGSGLPVDGLWTFSRVLASDDGRVPASQVMQVQFRAYLRAWGR